MTRELPRRRRAAPRPRLFFSFRSPFSWLLVHQLRRRLPEGWRDVTFIPYWEPDAATERALGERGARIQYAPMSRAKHLYILQDTKRLAARQGLRIAWPVDRRPWWEPSHLGWLMARRLGREAQFYDQVSAARWERGEDISDPAVVRDVAGRAGLDGELIAGAVDDPAIRAEGVQCLVDAYEDDIFGVPYLRLGWHRFWGLDRLDDFLAQYRPAELAADGGEPLAGIPAELQAGAGAYDTDSAGGCG